MTKEYNEGNRKESAGLANTRPKQNRPPGPHLPDLGLGAGLTESVMATPVDGSRSCAIFELPERFVDAATAAEFLSIPPRRLLDLARSNVLPGYPIGAGVRRMWRFRLSELARAIARGVDSRSAVPRSQKAKGKR